MMKCPLCPHSKMEIIEVAHASFRHYDFATVSESIRIVRCNTCQILFNYVDDKAKKKIDKLIRSKAYSLSKQTHHKLFVKDFQDPVTRPYLQAEILYKLIPNEKSSILDIGCFDGVLLEEMDSRLELAELYGYDVNHHLHSIFPKKENFHFLSSGLDKINNKFDLICLSHSIQYIFDTDFLMKQLKHLIKSDGILFIQTPDISKNPFAVLYGDQYYYYTSHILKNILKHFNFEFTSIKNTGFPRELLGIARLSPNNNFTDYIEDFQIYGCIQYLNDVANTLSDLSGTKRLGVLGATVNAAFVDSILKTKVNFFADEDRSRVGSKFRNKNVLHPESLEDSDFLIIPFGKSSHNIQERFENRYKGRFVSL